MDPIRSEYVSTIRPYYDAPNVEVPIRWYRAAPSARHLPYISAFRDSWYRNNRFFAPLVGQTHKFDATFVGNAGGFLGVRACGNAEAWRNGVSYLNPPPPCNCVREAVLPMQETPAGIVDGVNRVFTTSILPISAVSLLLFVNGVEQQQGVNYSLSGQTIFFSAPSTPTVNSNITVYYWYLS
jgi:hypothetical protein